MARKTRLVTGKGKALPPEFCGLAPDRYLVETAADCVPSLSPDEQTGIELALESYRQGRVVDSRRAREIIDATLVAGILRM